MIQGICFGGFEDALLMPTTDLFQSRDNARNILSFQFTTNKSQNNAACFLSKIFFFFFGKSLFLQVKDYREFN